MAYRVRLSDRAIGDITRQFRYIAENRNEPQSARNWHHGVIELISSLSEFPRRHATAPEADGLQVEVRSAVYFSHRILYGVDDESMTVTIFRVIHGAAGSFTIEHE